MFDPVGLRKFTIGRLKLNDRRSTQAKYSVMSNLVRNFTITGMFSVAVATLLLGYLYREDAVKSLIGHTVSKNIAFTQLFANNSWKRFYPYLGKLQELKREQIQFHPSAAEFISLMRRQTKRLNFVDGEIYTLNGDTVFSTQPDRLGSNVSSAPGFISAKSGRLFTTLETQNRHTSDGGILFNRNIVITYFPLNRRDGSQADAIFQIQTDITDAIQEIDQLQLYAFLLIGGILSALFLVLLALVKRTDAYIRLHTSKISDQAQMIEYQNYHDVLTGLPNRKLLIDRLQHAMHGAKRQKLLLAILCIDIDRFKNINDTYGQEAGDILLVEFAERLKLCIREYDTLAHLGGDNFTLICELIKHVDDVSEIANRVLEVTAEPFRIRGSELYVTPSIGIIMYPLDEDDESDLLNSAEVALTQAKREGGNAYKFYSTSIDRISFSRFSMENSIRKALERNEFELYYQPFVQIKTGKVLGVEALLRWNSPDLGLVNPDDFIPLLEETGLIIPVGRWVLEEACRQGVTWELKGIADLKINVNISVMQFHNWEIIHQLGDALESTEFKPHLLCLELTEGLLLDDFGDKDKILDEINEMGVSISLDDFGTGYSSMQYLKRIPIDTLKIDRSFIRDVVLNPEDSAIVDAICALAKSLRLNVIAEGVEKEEQFISLRALGVTAVQGYLLSRPLPAAVIEDLLLNGQLIGQHLVSPTTR